MVEKRYGNRTQGTECWFSLDEEWNGREEVLTPIDDKGIRTSVSGYHDGTEQRFYYVEQNHLLLSNLDHTEVKCLYGIPGNDQEICLLAVNDQGVFLSEKKYGSEEKESIVLWLTHDGKLKKKIPLKGNIVQAYICGSLIFYRQAVYLREGKLRSGDDNCCSAYWIDMDAGTGNAVFLARDERAQKGKPYNERSNCRHLSIEYLMGNDKGAVFKLSARYYYIDDDYDNVIEEEGEGWYYYDFKKIYCLSHSKCLPHSVYEKPQEYRQQREAYSVESMQWHRDIVAFNMEKNLMWVSKKQNKRKCWMPMLISGRLEKHIKIDQPAWEIPDDTLHVIGRWKEIFFDGERFYYYDDRQMCSLNEEGKTEKWQIEHLQAYKGIFRFNDYVFVRGGDHGYDKCFICPAGHCFQTICSVWPYIGGWGDREKAEEDRRLIENFDNVYETDEDKRQYKNEWKAASFVNEKEKEKDNTGNGSRQTVQNKVPTSQLEYWAGFRDYALKQNLDKKLKLSEAANHNWYAIRLGSATFRMECSVNTRKGTLRAAFFVKNAPDIFAQLKRNEDMVGSGLRQLGEVVWDGESQAANVSIITSCNGLNTEEQYNWFFQAVNRLYMAVFPYLDL